MNPVQVIKVTLCKWRSFEGKSSRSEFWCSASFLISTLLITNKLIVLYSFPKPPSNIVTAISLVIQLPLLVALVSLATRRLHDVNRHGAWLLLFFTYIGAIPVIYWLCCESKKTARFEDKTEPEEIGRQQTVAKNLLTLSEFIGNFFGVIGTALLVVSFFFCDDCSSIFDWLSTGFLIGASTIAIGYIPFFIAYALYRNKHYIPSIIVSSLLSPISAISLTYKLATGVSILTLWH